MGSPAIPANAPSLMTLAPVVTLTARLSLTTPRSCISLSVPEPPRFAASLRLSTGAPSGSVAERAATDADGGDPIVVAVAGDAASIVAGAGAAASSAATAGAV